MRSFNRRTPGRSLRTILMVWFIFFSIVPLVFITLYTIFKFEKAIDSELAQRLAGNGREISIIVSEYENALKAKRGSFFQDSSFRYHLSNEEIAPISKIAGQWLKNDFVSGYTFYNREGSIITSLYKDSQRNVKSLSASLGSKTTISTANLKLLEGTNVISFVNFEKDNRLQLVSLSKVQANNKTYGYFEQTLDLEYSFIKKLKDRMQLEIVFLSPEGKVLLSSHNDISLYKPGYFSKYFKSASLLNLTIRGTPFGFTFQKAKWGNSEFILAMGANKNDSKAVLRNVNYTFFSVVSVIAILLIVSIFVASNIFLKPIYELLEGIQSMHDIEAAIEIPIKNDTEIGLLTSSFNEMSRKIAETQRDLKKKINELEFANSEIKEAQTQLVQSAKMASLGQLVAGVAHELNNPIGFIFSNMIHLREYSDKLLQLVEIAEKDPSAIANAKDELEIEYIKSDLPKLVKSCEDGARRTKDIVLGLRNFSRLQEAQLKEVNLEESLNNTLDLLAGEMKNRVVVNKDFSGIPLVHCFASQINQVFMNILSNAVQAIEGQGELWLTTKPLKGPEGIYNRVAISIQDSGKGISPEILERIFDPFFTTKGVGQGTGLGLSISYGIIQNHGGEIHVRSQVGVGTEFTIILPIKAKI